MSERTRFGFEMEKAGWDPGRAAELHDDTEVQRVLAYAETEVVPRQDRTTDELDSVLNALEGGFEAWQKINLPVEQ